jgi:hypothetical protein
LLSDELLLLGCRHESLRLAGHALHLAGELHVHHRLLLLLLLLL